MKQPPNIGERLVIHGMSRFAALVESVEWNHESRDWMIRVDWGSYGKSRVWQRDEGKVWNRWLQLN